MGIKVVCKTSDERTNELKCLFDKMKPYLEEGKSYNQALCIVKKTKTSYSHTQWFKDLVKYGESQGYPKENYENYDKYGVLNIHLNRHDCSLTGYYWIYEYYEFYDDWIGCKKKYIADDNLINLKKRVEEKGLPWKVINKFKAENSFKLNEELQSNKKPKKTGQRGKKSSSGVKYVSKLKNKNAKKNYFWSYKHGVTLQATTLEKLKHRLEKRGIPWIIIDEELYEKNLLED